MRIGRFRKAVADRKRYVVDYNDWLGEGEVITLVTVSGTVEDDEFYVDGYEISPGGREAIFFVSGGKAETEYDVTVTIDTSLQQIKEDWVTFMVT